jgi:hypothetical protein
MAIILVGILVYLLGSFLEKRGRELALRDVVPVDPERLAINGVDFVIEEEIDEGLELLTEEGILNKDGKLLDKRKGVLWLITIGKKRSKTEKEKSAIEILAPILQKG